MSRAKQEPPTASRAQMPSVTRPKIQQPRLLVLVPAFNEQESIGAVIAEIKRHLPLADCLVIDDGSSDQTGERARKAGALVARPPFNMGVGGAMRLGFRYALSQGYDVAVQIDADGQHDPASVPIMLRALENADIVIGSRFSGAGDYKVRGPRQWAMRLLSVILSRITRTRLDDTTSGFKAIGPRAIELFSETFPAEYLGDTIEALVIAARANLRIAQIPVVMRVRMAGTPSHNPAKAAIYLGRAMLALAVAVIRSR